MGDFHENQAVLVSGLDLFQLSPPIINPQIPKDLESAFAGNAEIGCFPLPSAGLGAGQDSSFEDAANPPFLPGFFKEN